MQSMQSMPHKLHKHCRSLLHTQNRTSIYCQTARPRCSKCQSLLTVSQQSHSSACTWETDGGRDVDFCVMSGCTPQFLQHSLAIPGEGRRVVLPTGDLHHADLPQDLDLPRALQLSGPHTCIAVSVSYVRG